MPILDTKKKKEKKCRSATSAVLRDGTLVEQIHAPEADTVAFAVWRDEKVETVPSVDTDAGERLLPYSAENNLLRNNVVLFPSAPEAYGEPEELVESITRYIRRYVDIEATFASICAGYVLLSWVYDRFNELPYLRVRGDYGSGKTRFLLTVGSICYRPIFASGASTVAPLFHILDQIGGTLLVDEADFRFSDQTADIVKILNNGNARGFPVLRCEVVNGKEFRPRSYSVFGPKLVATRADYDDAALESRFITENMGTRRMRSDIPLNLPAQHRKDALQLRNQLLMYRFSTYTQHRVDETTTDSALEPRANQTLSPLLAVLADSVTRKHIIDRARTDAAERRAERAMSIEAHVLEAIVTLRETERAISINAIAAKVTAEHGQHYERRITPKWIGHVVRKQLHLRTQKAHGNYVLAENQDNAVEVLREKYDV